MTGNWNIGLIAANYKFAGLHPACNPVSKIIPEFDTNPLAELEDMAQAKYSPDRLDVCCSQSYFIGVEAVLSETDPVKRRNREAAKRALAEAEQRRGAAEVGKKKRPAEIQGRDGPDPARFGDWEKDGIASDF